MNTFQKTTHANFLPYGDVIESTLDHSCEIDSNPHLFHASKEVSALYRSNQNFSFKVIDGIALVLVTDCLQKPPVAFVIHRSIRLHPDIYFGFVAISNYTEINVSENLSILSTYPITPFVYQPFISQVHTRELLGNYYVIRSPKYQFQGKAHDYWELTYVDDGTLLTTVDRIPYTVENQELILYAPGQIHTQRTVTGCSYLTLLFHMDISDEDTVSLTDRSFSVNREIKKLLDQINRTDTYTAKYTTEFLLSNIQSIIVQLLIENERASNAEVCTEMQQKYNNNLLNEMILYIKENLFLPLTVDDLCYKYSISRTSIQVLFKENLKMSPKQFISEMKFMKSRQLIKSSTYSISEISRICGFPSVQYFSRKFKDRYGITPSSYAKSIG